MRRLKYAFAVVVLVLAFGSPPRAEAQFLVYDALNWIENAIQVVQQNYQIYQQYEQLYNDYLRYATMVKNLSRFDQMTFHNLVGLAQQVNDIIRYGESLGHTLSDIDAQFAATFPGYEPILESDWLQVFRHRNKRTLDTLRYSVDALNKISEDSIPSQHILGRIRADAEGADGALKALQASNQFLHQQGGQLSKISQELSLQTNIQAVYWAYLVDQEAAERATTSQWIANAVARVPPYDSVLGARGVPADGPWACFGCLQPPVRRAP